MTVRGAAFAGLIYASLMTAFNAWSDEPFRGSYALGFVFYAVTFGVLFFLLMRLYARWRSSRSG